MPTTYFDTVRVLQYRYPSLVPFYDYLCGPPDHGQQLVQETCRNLRGTPPGRVAVLEFQDGHVAYKPFSSSESLLLYLQQSSSPGKCFKCRLFLMEDLAPEYVEILGRHLQVDPTVFCNQLSTWHENEAYAKSHRMLPSMVDPESAFTLHYWELRHANDLSDYIRKESQVSKYTFAIARRKFDALDIPTQRNWTGSAGMIRRFTSFWSKETDQGWDALMLLDPPVEFGAQEAFILSRQKRSWGVEDHKSSPLWGGYPDFLPPVATTREGIQGPPKNSMLDDIVYYWTNAASVGQIRRAEENRLETSYFLLKIVTTKWFMFLDMLNFISSQLETHLCKEHVFSRGDVGSRAWQVEWEDLKTRWRPLDNLQRRLLWTESKLVANMQRLGLATASKASSSEPKAQSIIDAEKDFGAILDRLEHLKARVTVLRSMLTDILAEMEASKALYDRALSQRLTMIGAVVFPFTFVATFFGMGGRYLPGEKDFWVFFAVAIPLSTVVCTSLFWSRKSAQNAISDLRRKVERKRASTRDRNPSDSDMEEESLDKFKV